MGVASPSDISLHHNAMLVDRTNLSKHGPWIVICILMTVLAVAWYVWHVMETGRYPGGSTWPGLTFGTAGGLLIVFEFMIWPRKKLRRLRLGKMQLWMRAHIWLGLLSVPMIVLHGGFWGRSLLVNLLLVLFYTVIISGVFGLVMQQVLPKMMLHFVPSETVHSQIDYVAAQYAREAEALVEMLCGSSLDDDQDMPPAAKATSRSSNNEPTHLVIGAHRTVGSVGGKTVQTVIRQEPVRHAELLQSVFRNSVKPFLIEGNRGCPKLTDRVKSRVFFEDLRLNFEDATVLRAVDTMEEYCEHRRQFDLQSRLHWWLHGWLCLHLPFSLALVLLMFIHIVLALKYS